jgi:hypothetical protein
VFQCSWHIPGRFILAIAALDVHTLTQALQYLITNLITFIVHFYYRTHRQQQLRITLLPFLFDHIRRFASPGSQFPDLLTCNDNASQLVLPSATVRA